MRVLVLLLISATGSCGSSSSSDVARPPESEDAAAIANGNFEQWSGPAPAAWTITYGPDWGTIFSRGAEVRSGGGALRISLSVNLAVQVKSAPFPAASGRPFVWARWSQTQSGAVALLGVQWFDAAGVPVGQSSVEARAADPQWHRYEFQSAPATAATGVVKIGLEQSSAPAYLLVDDVGVLRRP